MAPAPPFALGADAPIGERVQEVDSDDEEQVLPPAWDLHGGGGDRR